MARAISWGELGVACTFFYLLDSATLETPAFPLFSSKSPHLSSQKHACFSSPANNAPFLIFPMARLRLSHAWAHWLWLQSSWPRLSDMTSQLPTTRLSTGHLGRGSHETGRRSCLLLPPAGGWSSVVPGYMAWHGMAGLEAKLRSQSNLISIFRASLASRAVDFLQEPLVAHTIWRGM